jgi:hypothetical protein
MAAKPKAKAKPKAAPKAKSKQAGKATPKQPKASQDQPANQPKSTDQPTMKQRLAKLKAMNAEDKKMLRALESRFKPNPIVNSQ